MKRIFSPSPRRRIGLIVSLVTLLVLLVSATASAAHHGPRTYEVTIRNLTGGQPLTPPLLATHDRHFDLFQVGHSANEGIQQLAENGNLAPALALLNSSAHVADVVVADVPLVPAGTPGSATFPDTVTVTIQAQRPGQIPDLRLDACLHQ